MNPRAVLQERYPASDFSFYFRHLEACMGTEKQRGRTHEHHICPCKQFPEYEHDEPANLITLTIEDHSWAHRLLWRAHPDFSQHIEKWVAAQTWTPERSAQHSARQKIIVNRQEVAARIVAGLKAAHARPGARARHSASMKAVHARPEVKARHSAALKAAHARPEVRARNSAAQKIAQSCPEVRARNSAAVTLALSSPEARARISAGVKASWARRKKKAQRL